MPNNESKKMPQYGYGVLNNVDTTNQDYLDPQTTSYTDVARKVAKSAFIPDILNTRGPLKGICLYVRKKPSPFNYLNYLDPKPNFLLEIYARVPELDSVIPEPENIGNGAQDAQSLLAISRHRIYVAKDSEVEEPTPGALVWLDFGNKGTLADPIYLGPVFPEGGDGQGNRTIPSSTESARQSSDCPADLSMAAPNGNPPLAGLTAKQKYLLENPSEQNWDNMMYVNDSSIVKKVNTSFAHGNKKKDKAPHKIKSGIGSIRTNKAGFNTLLEYVSSGGSGLAVSGQMGLASCRDDSRTIFEQWVLAQRIAVEDQAERGYHLGSKRLWGRRPELIQVVNRKYTPEHEAHGGWKGMDCTMFVHATKVLSEMMLDPVGMSQTETGFPSGQIYGYEDAKDDGRLYHWSSRNFESRFVVKRGRNIMGGDRKQQWDGTVPIMPGDEIQTGPKGGYADLPSWASNPKRILPVTHILVAFVAPDGRLRVAESGGPFGGTGSRDYAKWLSDMRKKGKRIWVHEPRELTKFWPSVGGRPAEEWTPELAKKLLPNIVSLDGNMPPVENTVNTTDSGGAATQQSIPSQAPATESDVSSLIGMGISLGNAILDEIPNPFAGNKSVLETQAEKKKNVLPKVSKRNEPCVEKTGGDSHQGPRKSPGKPRIKSAKITEDGSRWNGGGFRKEDPWAVVLHSQEGFARKTNEKTAKKWATKSVGTHFYITKKGDILLFLNPLKFYANHSAGGGMNGRGVGVDFEGFAGGTKRGSDNDPSGTFYTEEQLKSLARLLNTGELRKLAVTSHWMWQKNRKDPGRRFPWDTIIKFGVEPTRLPGVFGAPPSKDQLLGPMTKEQHRALIKIPLHTGAGLEGLRTKIKDIYNSHSSEDATESIHDICEDWQKEFVEIPAVHEEYEEWNKKRNKK